MQQIGELIEQYPTAFSLFCATLGSFFTAFGLILMKIATIRAEKKNSNAFVQRDYLLGLFVVLFGQVFTALALKYGNIILISSTSCFCIIITAMLTPCMLQEKFMWRVDGVSIGLISAGCVMAIYQQPQNVTEDFNANNVTASAVDKFTNIRTVLFILALCVNYFIRQWLYNNMVERLNEFNNRVIEHYLAIKNKGREVPIQDADTETNREQNGIVADLKPSEGLFTKISTHSIESEVLQDKIASDESDSPINGDLKEEGRESTRMGPADGQDLTEESIAKPPLRILVSIVQRNSLKELNAIMGATRQRDLNLTKIKSYKISLHLSLQAFLIGTSMLSGALCGVTSTAIKLALEIFSYSPQALTNYMFYAMLMVLALTSVLNFLNLTTTLMLYSQLYTMPPYESCVIFGNLLAGGIIMNEFQAYNPWQIVWLFIGSAIAVFGILYKVSFIDEDQLDNAMQENGDDANQARRDDNAGQSAGDEAQEMNQFNSVDHNGIAKNDEAVVDKQLKDFEDVVLTIKKDLARASTA